MLKVKLPPKVECLRCGHAWRPRQAEVRICPRCKSAWWDQPRVPAPPREAEKNLEDSGK